MTSLIIITLRRAALLAQTLEALGRQTRPLDEVVIVDNGPDAETEAVARRFGARYIAEPRRGYGCARNRGLAEARGDILYFLDDDCVAEPDWAAMLFDGLACGRADFIGGSRVSGRRGLAARVEYLSTDGPVLSPRLPAGSPAHLSTSNLIFRREAAARTGAFDESLAMCEDRDFTARARALGFRLRFEPRAQVTHYSSVFSMQDYLGRMRHYGFGTSQYFVQIRAGHGPALLARLFPRSPAARLLLLPLLAAAGTGYLVLRNLPQHWDAIPLSPLLFLGQLWWHWGGFEAMRRYTLKQ
jgi:GT2 family glycosyltransferase